MQQIDLSEHLRPGANTPSISEQTGSASGYQIAFRHHVSGGEATIAEPLAIRLDYERSDLRVGQMITATASIANQISQVAPMIIVDLPIPAGFQKLQDHNRMTWLGLVLDSGRRL